MKQDFCSGKTFTADSGQISHTQLRHDDFKYAGGALPEVSSAVFVQKVKPLMEPQEMSCRNWNKKRGGRPVSAAGVRFLQKMTQTNCEAWRWKADNEGFDTDAPALVSPS